jgi:hypothetical protein
MKYPLRQNDTKPFLELSARFFRPFSWGITSTQLKVVPTEYKLFGMAGAWTREGLGMVLKVETRFCRQKQSFELSGLGLNLNYNIKLE